MPDILFTIPEEFGGFDCHAPVSDEKLQEVQLECTQREEIEDENQLYQEYFCYLMEFYKLQCQSNYNEAVQMFDESCTRHYCSYTYPFFW